MVAIFDTITMDQKTGPNKKNKKKYTNIKLLHPALVNRTHEIRHGLVLRYLRGERVDLIGGRVRRRAAIGAVELDAEIVVYAARVVRRC